jgi:hypothetical protein
MSHFFLKVTTSITDQRRRKQDPRGLMPARDPGIAYRRQDDLVSLDRWIFPIFVFRNIRDPPTPPFSTPNTRRMSRVPEIPLRDVLSRTADLADLSVRGAWL